MAEGCSLPREGTPRRPLLVHQAGPSLRFQDDKRLYPLNTNHGKKTTRKEADQG